MPRLLPSLRPFLAALPDVEAPDRKIIFRERLLWTGVVMLIFLGECPRTPECGTWLRRHTFAMLVLPANRNRRVCGLCSSAEETRPRPDGVPRGRAAPVVTGRRLRSWCARLRRRRRLLFGRAHVPPEPHGVPQQTLHAPCRPPSPTLPARHPKVPLLPSPSPPPPNSYLPVSLHDVRERASCSVLQPAVVRRVGE